MIDQERPLRSMMGRLAAFSPGSFWVGKGDEASSLILGTERCVYKIRHMRVDLTTQDRETFIFDEANWPVENTMVLDDGGREPACARLALLQQKRETIKGKDVLAISADSSPLSGSIFVFAETGMSEDPLIAVSALFCEEDGRQTSCILWDASEHLLAYWAMEAKLLRRKEEHCVQQQYQASALSEGYERAVDFFEYQEEV